MPRPADRCRLMPLGRPALRVIAVFAPLAVPAAAEPLGDAAAMLALAPDLRACLAGAGPGAFLTDATRDAAGVLRAVLRDGGRTVVCVLRGGEPPLLAPAPGAAPPDPAGPALFRDRRCVDARRVDAPDGTVLGWVAYPAC